jgi:uncharacterized RDD family membrane protein YckC
MSSAENGTAAAGPAADPRFPWHTATPALAAEPSTRPPVRGLRAGFVTRVCAAVTDVGLVLLALLAGYAGVAGLRFLTDPTGFSPSTPPYGAVLIAAGVLLGSYWTMMWALSGRSYGDQLLGLRVVGPGGRRLHWSHAAARAVLCTVFPLGLLWVLLSPRNRSVQDVVLRTAVVYD